VVTPQKISKVRRHVDLCYYFLSSHVILSWNILPQSVIDFSSVNQGRGQNILFVGMARVMASTVARACSVVWGLCPQLGRGAKLLVMGKGQSCRIGF